MQGQFGARNLLTVASSNRGAQLCEESFDSRSLVSYLESIVRTGLAPLREKLRRQPNPGWHGGEAQLLVHNERRKPNIDAI